GQGNPKNALRGERQIGRANVLFDRCHAIEREWPRRAGPAILDRHVAALDITGFVEALAERGHHGCVPLRRPAVEEADHRHRRLLRPRCERPCGYTAAEKCDEFPPPHGASPKAKDGSVARIATKRALYDRAGVIGAGRPLMSVLPRPPTGAAYLWRIFKA